MMSQQQDDSSKTPKRKSSEEVNPGIHEQARERLQILGTLSPADPGASQSSNKETIRTINDNYHGHCDTDEFADEVTKQRGTSIGFRDERRPNVQVLMSRGHLQDHDHHLEDMRVPISSEELRRGRGSWEGTRHPRHAQPNNEEYASEFESSLDTTKCRQLQRFFEEHNDEYEPQYTHGYSRSRIHDGSFQHVTRGSFSDQRDYRSSVGSYYEGEGSISENGLFIPESIRASSSASYRPAKYRKVYQDNEHLHQGFQSRSEDHGRSTQGNMTDYAMREISPAPPLDTSHQRKRYFNLPSPQYDMPPVESVVGVGLEDSRYSGRNDEKWHVSKKQPEKTRVEKVTKAALEKRGLKEGQEETVIKRGYGAYDPENVEIVNLKETTNMSFQDIADHLNKKRVNDGRNPTLTSMGIHGRYNRNAPILFESQGKVFVPLAKRRKDNPEAKNHGKSRNPNQLDNATWNEELDLKLVQIVREYDADKWHVVKQRFEEETGYSVEKADQLAKRYNLL